MERTVYREYKKIANMMTEGENNIWVRVEYDFAIHLQLGDVVHLSDEDEEKLSPFIYLVELGEVKDFFRREYEVVRRDFTANGLWIIIEEV